MEWERDENGKEIKGKEQANRKEHRKARQKNTKRSE